MLRGAAQGAGPGLGATGARAASMETQDCGGRLGGVFITLLLAVAEARFGGFEVQTRAQMAGT